MIKKLFADLKENYRPGQINTAVSYYFSVDDLRWTVVLAPDNCRVEEGKTIEPADCVCKIGGKLLLEIWYNGYRPGVKDFLAGAIRSNNPTALKSFLEVYGKG